MHEPIWYGWPVQLNVHVPKDREDLLSELDRLARDLDRTKSQLVLDAVERYLDTLRQQVARDLDEDIPVYDLGTIEPFRRGELYEEREDAKLPR